MRSVQKLSSHVLWKIETFIEEDIRHRKHCTQDNDTSVPFEAGPLGPHTVLLAFLPLFKTLCSKFGADSLCYSLSHSECDSHTVHMLTQQCLLPPLTSTVKLSLFTHAHSSPHSLIIRIHHCHANHSHYINNGWTLSGLTHIIEEQVLQCHRTRVREGKSSRLGSQIKNWGQIIQDLESYWIKLCV